MGKQPSLPITVGKLLVSSLSKSLYRTFKHLWTTTTIFILVFATAREACSDSAIKIGVTLPLSGAAAAWGVATKNGFEMAQRDRPELFTSLQFIYEDTQLEPRLAVSAFRKLIHFDQVHLAYDFGSCTSLALGAIAEQEGVLLFSSAFDPAVSQGKSHVVRFASSTVQFVRPILTHFRAKGSKRFSIIVADNAYFENYAETFRRELRADESIVYHHIHPQETDLRALISKIKLLDPQPEALGLFTFFDQGMQLLRKVREQHLQIPLFGTDAFEEITENREYAALAEGLVYSNNLPTEEFVHRYRESFGNIAQVTFAGGAYDLAMLLGRELNRLQNPSRDIVQIKLEGASLNAGVLGDHSFEDTTADGKHFRTMVGLKVIEERLPIHALPGR